MRHRPCSLRRRVRRLPFVPRNSRGDGAPSGATISYVRTFFWKARRLSALHPDRLAPSGLISAAFCFGAGTALSACRVVLPPALGWRPLLGGRTVRASGRPARPTVSELLAGDRSVPGRSPAPPGWRGVCFVPRPRAPHPIPLSERLMTTPLGGSDQNRNTCLGYLVKGILRYAAPCAINLISP